MLVLRSQKVYRLSPVVGEYSWWWVTVGSGVLIYVIMLEKIVSLYRNIEILSAADMSKRAMILLGTNKELKELGFRILFPVHDIFM